MAFYYLPTGKLHKTENIRKLNNFAKTFQAGFYKNRLYNMDEAFDFNFQRKLISILVSVKLDQHMQEDIDMYITKDRLNEASFKCKLDPMFKNINRRQNPPELVFKGVSTFDAQHLCVRSLIREIEIGKRDLASELVKKHQNQ